MQIKLHKGYCLREDRAVRSAFRIYCLLAVLDAPVFSVSCNYKSQKCLCSGESWRLRILRLHVLFSTFTAEMSRNLLFLPAFCSWYHPQMLPVPLVNRAIYHKSSAFPSSVFFTGEKKKGTILIYEYSICSCKSRWKTAQQPPTAPRSPTHPEQGWLRTQPSSCCTNHLFPDFCLPVSSNLFCTNHSIPVALFKVTLQAILEAPLSAY